MLCLPRSDAIGSGIKCTGVATASVCSLCDGISITHTTRCVMCGEENRLRGKKGKIKRRATPVRTRKVIRCPLYRWHKAASPDGTRLLTNVQTRTTGLMTWNTNYVVQVLRTIYSQAIQLQHLQNREYRVQTSLEVF